MVNLKYKQYKHNKINKTYIISNNILNKYIYPNKCVYLSVYKPKLNLDKNKFNTSISLTKLGVSFTKAYTRRYFFHIKKIFKLNI